MVDVSGLGPNHKTVKLLITLSNDATDSSSEVGLKGRTRRKYSICIRVLVLRIGTTSGTETPFAPQH